MSDKKMVYRIDPFDTYDITRREVWLEEQAEKGLMLKDFVWLLASFERAEPKKLRYRIEPVRSKEAEPAEAEIEIYENSGWEYVTTLKNAFHVYRTENTFAPETHTDPEVEKLAFSKIKRDAFISVLLEAVAIAVAVGFFTVIFGSDAPFITLVRSGSLRVALCCAAILFALISGVIQCGIMLRFNKERQGREEIKKDHFKRKAVLSIAFRFITLALMLAFFITNFAYSLGGDIGMDIHSYDGEFRFPLLQEVEGAEDCSGYLGKDSDLLAPEMLTVSQYGSAGGKDISLYVNYFEFSAEWAARAAWKEMEGLYFSEVDYVKTELGEGAALYEFDGYQALVLARERRAVYYCYKGSVSLEESLALFEVKLSAR